MKKLLSKFRRYLPRKVNWKIVAVFVLGFILLNAAVYGVFLSRSYPNTQINTKALGSVAESQVPAKIDQMQLLSASVNLVHQEKVTSVGLSELGIAIDRSKTSQHVAANKHWLPLLNFIVAHQTPLLLKVNEPTFKEKLNELAQIYKAEPLDAKVLQDGGNFSLQKPVDGYKLKKSLLRTAIINNLAQNKTTVELPTEAVKPKVTEADLTPAINSLQAQQNVSIIYRYQTKSHKPSPQDIGNWYEPDITSYKLSDSKIGAYLTQVGSNFGIRLQNLTQAVSSTKEAVQNIKTLDLTLTAAPAVRRSYSYCVVMKNVDGSYLAEFESKIKAVFGDNRGWMLGGLVSFSQVGSSCNFTLWLSAADQMPTFGSICSSDWSCRVGRNVVINFDRWRNASDAWNQSGGSLDDYRSMVINHETGHWLGFGHLHCGGAGQLAPVMQQQSINLEGCKFNPWALASELDSLKRFLGL